MDSKKLTRLIDSEAPEHKPCKAFSFFERESPKMFYAGINGFLVYGAVHIDQLWVAPAYRNQGIARALVEKAEAYGLSHGCTMATVNTMSFQNALPFYLKCGYVVDFERPGYAYDSSMIFLKKIFIFSR